MDTNYSLRLEALSHCGLKQARSIFHCFQSLTGTKFFVVCEPGTQRMEGLLELIYELQSRRVRVALLGRRSL